MQKYCVFTGLLIFFAMLIGRAVAMKKRGIKAVVFASTDKTDYFIVPFFLVFIYEVIANTFQWPLPFGRTVNQLFYDMNMVRWIGVAVCAISLLGFYLCLRSFGDSFRVGIDEKNPDKLVTTGIYAISRNPIYVSFLLFFLGLLLVFPNIINILVLALAIILFHRQVLREEAFLKNHYGGDYIHYCKRVKRYL